MPEHPFEAQARAALLEITPESSVGEFAGATDDGDGTVTLRFASALAGYPGWRWTVSIAQVDGSEPTVLETELMPGDGALLAPDWVPWSDRLAEYKAAQEAAEAEAADAAEDDVDGDDDDLDDDDLLGSDVLHSGDLDGVDIDDPDGDDDDEFDADDDVDDDDDDDDVIDDDAVGDDIDPEDDPLEGDAAADSEPDRL